MTTKTERSQKTLWVVIICAILVAVPAAVTFLQKRGIVPALIQESLNTLDRVSDKISDTISDESSDTISEDLTSKSIVTGSIGELVSAPSFPEENLPEKSFIPSLPAPVVDYGKLKEDKSLQTLMDRRKETYGFEKGVDIIIKSNESLKLGDETIAMQEIVESMRLDSGEVVEKDITESETLAKSEASIEEELYAVETRLKAIEKRLKSSDELQDTKTDKGVVREYETLKEIESVYKAYQETIKEIEEKQELLKRLTAAETKVSLADEQPPLEEVLKSTESLKEDDPAEKPPVRTEGIQTEARKSAAFIEATPSEREILEPLPSKDEALERKSFFTKKPAIKTANPEENIRDQRGYPPLKEEGMSWLDTEPAAKRPVERLWEEKAHGPDKTSVGMKPGSSPMEKLQSAETLPQPPDHVKPFIEKEIATTPKPRKKISPKDIKTLIAMKNLEALAAMKESLRDEINTLLLQKGDLEAELKILLKKKERPEAYGIYVVRTNDNLWNIHFKFLKEYFNQKGIQLSSQSDEPDETGQSSGVGKILKFSESMVFIYNIREHRRASDINLLYPYSKIIVFNMEKVFELLKDLEYSDINRLEFDGENLWLPARAS
jgi:hypothetical protein